MDDDGGNIIERDHQRPKILSLQNFNQNFSDLLHDFAGGWGKNSIIILLHLTLLDPH